jgi:hypothetical protein
MKALKAFAGGILVLSAISLLIAVALNLANIVGRYVFFSPIASAEEIMLFLSVGTVFLGNSVVGWEASRSAWTSSCTPCRLRRGAPSTCSPTSPSSWSASR